MYIYKDTLFRGLPLSTSMWSVHNQITRLKVCLFVLVEYRPVKLEQDKLFLHQILTWLSLQKLCCELLCQYTSRLLTC